MAPNFRSFLLRSVSNIAIVPGMNAAELACRKNKIDAWMTARPQEARKLANEIAAGLANLESHKRASKHAKP